MDLTLHYTSVSHSESVMAAINKMRASQTLCDVALIVGGTRILAHEVILAAAVPLFYQLSQMCPGNMAIPEYRLDDVDETAAMKVIEFCYTSTISVDGDSLWSILTAATKLGCMEVINICCEMLVSMLDVATCVQTFMKAFELKCDCLLMSAGQFLLENIEMVCVSSSVLSLTGEKFAKLMAGFTYSQAKEETLIKLGKCWLAQDPKNRRLFVPQLVAEFPDVAHKLLKYLDTELTIDKSQPALRTGGETYCAEEAERLSQVSAENYSSSHTDKEVPIHICVCCGDAFDCEWQMSQHHQVCSESAYAGIKVKDELICQFGFETSSAKAKVKDELICQLGSKPASTRPKVKSKSLKTQLDASLSCNINETNNIETILSSKETESFGGVATSNYGENQTEFDVAKSCNVSIQESDGLATSFQGFSQICDNLSSNCDTMTGPCNHAAKSFDYSDQLREQTAIVCDRTTHLCNHVTKSCDYSDQSCEHTAALCDRTTEPCNHMTRLCDYSAQPPEHVATVCKNQNQDCDKVAEVCNDSTQTHNNVGGQHTNNRQTHSNPSSFLHIKTQSPKLGTISCEDCQIPASGLEACNDEIQSRSSEKFPPDSKILKYKQIIDSHTFNKDSRDCNPDSGHQKKNLQSLRKDHSQYNSHQSNLPLNNSKHDKPLQSSHFSESSEMKSSGDESKDDLSSRGFCQPLQEAYKNEDKDVQNLSNKICPSFLSSSSVALPTSQNTRVSDSNNNNINDSKSGQAGCFSGCGVKGISVGSNTESDFSIGVRDKCNMHINGDNNGDFSINANDKIEFSINANEKDDFRINSNNKGDFSINSNSKVDFSNNSNYKDDFINNTNDKNNSGINTNSKDDSSNVSNTQNDVKINSGTVHSFAAKPSSNVKLQAESCYDFAEEDDNATDFGKDQIIRKATGTVGRKRPRKNTIYGSRMTGAPQGKLQNLGTRAKFSLLKFKCLICSRAFSERKSLSNHERLAHGLQQGFVEEGLYHLPEDLSIVTQEKGDKDVRDVRNMTSGILESSKVNVHTGVSVADKNIYCDGDRQKFSGSLIDVSGKRRGAEVDYTSNVNSFTEWCLGAVFCHFCGAFHPKETVCPHFMAAYRSQQHGVMNRADAGEVGRVADHFTGSWAGDEGPLDMSKGSQDYQVLKKPDLSPKSDEDGDHDLPLNLSNMYTPHPPGRERQTNFWNLHLSPTSPFITQMDLASNFPTHANSPLSPSKMTEDFTLNRADISRQQPHKISPYSIDSEGNMVTVYREHAVHSKKRAMPHRDFPCPMCGRVFTYKTALLTHMKTHSLSPCAYQCQLCQQLFPSSTDLRLHVCANGVEKPHKCIHCDQTFAKNIHLKRHLATHSGLRPYPCWVCGKRFSRSDHLKRHAQSLHADSRPHGCQTCGKEFVRKYELNKHMMVHTSNSASNSQE